MNHNITPEYVKQISIVSNLLVENDEIIQKYITRALSLVLSYINGQIFFDESSQTYTFPEELMQAIVYVLEMIYIDQGMFTGKNSIQSEKIGDYSYQKKQDSRSFPLDLPANIMAMLDKYRTVAWNLDIDIGGVDRLYPSNNSDD